ncbi:recombinase family protein [Paenibacillus swuensis]|uniref:recombinase family protein n=1 Tax=Paenibacillus swuensis TaxID=1178515 RepID=UPI000838F9BC|nr:recombinase family protein [Paenibacillus swuensis]
MEAITPKNELVNKRVACLYRVSTRAQLLGDDMPMQKRACRDFVDKQGWTLVKEYTEKGVSGYRVSVNKRGELQKAKLDAEDGLYDILLVFMFDRLGRRDDEMPIIMNWFNEKGVELWSTQEGQQKFDDYSDKLKNYIRFWQSNGESENTSIRVRENHTQMAEDGLFRGGRAAFGYKLIESGIKNKKGKELMKPVIKPDEAKIIDEIYTYVDEYGFGSNRIAKYMNNERVPFVAAPNGGQWSAGVINFILRNPVYKGYPTYGKRTSDMGVFSMQKPQDWVVSKKQIIELVIIPENKWDRVQQSRSKRSPNKKTQNSNDEPKKITKSPLLFVGMAKCGHCGAPLTTTYNRKTYTLVDGTKKIWTSPKYRCSGKASGKICNGQTIYSPNKIEKIVLEELDIFLDELKQINLKTEIESFNKNNIDGDSQELRRLQNEIEKKYKELFALTSEVPKSIMGQSSFKAELLNTLIDQKNNEITEESSKLSNLQIKVKEMKVEVDEMEMLRKHIPVWKEVYKNSPLEKQKMMLGVLINNIVVTRDRVEVNVKLHIQEIIGNEQANPLTS